MGNADAGRAADDPQRAADQARHAQADAVIARLREILAPLAPEFAVAAGAVDHAAEWTFRIRYNFDTSPDGYVRHGRAAVTVRADGAFDVTSPTAAHGTGDVYAEVVRESVTKALEEILDAA